MNQVQRMVNNRSQGTLEILAYDKIKYGVDNQYHYAIVSGKMGGSIRKLLNKKDKLTEKQAIEWGRKIIRCQKHLYDSKVLYRDLKLDNVLQRKLGDQIIFKIADFGNSRSSNVSRSLTIGKGTKFYISPQQQKQEHYTNKTDVYAFGCMIFEFLVGSEKVLMVISKVVSSSGEIDSKEVGKVLLNLGISKRMIVLIERFQCTNSPIGYLGKIFFNILQYIERVNLKMKEGEKNYKQIPRSIISESPQAQTHTPGNNTIATRSQIQIGTFALARVLNMTQIGCALNKTQLLMNVNYCEWQRILIEFTKKQIQQIINHHQS